MDINLHRLGDIYYIELCNDNPDLIFPYIGRFDDINPGYIECYQDLIKNFKTLKKDRDYHFITPPFQLRFYTYSPKDVCKRLTLRKICNLVQLVGFTLSKEDRIGTSTVNKGKLIDTTKLDFTVKDFLENIRLDYNGFTRSFIAIRDILFGNYLIDIGELKDEKINFNQEKLWKY